ncbi:MAG: PH domain-containing protein [Actinomycetota bacterium]|nr:PH domain-containing protein [Actinomycetota bacterium]
MSGERRPEQTPGALPLPWRYRPLGIRLMAAVMGTLMVGALAFFWVALPGSVRDQFSLEQRVTLLLIFATMLAFLYGIARSAIRADDAGLRIVNVYKVRRLEWAQVVHVRLQPGDPWAVLDIDDGTTVKAMAIQGSDGRRARRATEHLRDLVEEHSRTPRDD